jgi:hypothetical protein
MTVPGMLSISLLALACAAVVHAAPPPTLDAAAAERFAHLALACVHKEYPNKIGHLLNSDADVKPPRELTPAFYGCYDWHSTGRGEPEICRPLPCSKGESATSI